MATCLSSAVPSTVLACPTEMEFVFLPTPDLLSLAEYVENVAPLPKVRFVWNTDVAMLMCSFGGSMPRWGIFAARRVICYSSGLVSLVCHNIADLCCYCCCFQTFLCSELVKDSRYWRNCSLDLVVVVD
jgi:hypothetical protein